MADVSTLTVRSGTYTLKDIISRRKIEYLTLENVSAMISTSSLQSGDLCFCQGYYNSGDGGASYFIITNEETPETYYVTLNNGLKAVLLLENSMNAKQFGAYGDGIHDDHDALQSLIDSATICTLVPGTYLNSAVLNISDNEKCMQFDGNGSEIQCSTNGLEFQMFVSKSDIIIKNTFFNQNLRGRKAIHLQNVSNITIESVTISGFTASYGWTTNENALYIDNSTNILVNHCHFLNNGNQYDTTATTLNRCIGTSGGYTFRSNIKITNCNFENVNQAIVLDCSDIIIDSCYFTNVKDNIMYSFGNDITFINNRCENTSDEGLVIGSQTGGTYIIKNNIFNSVRNRHIIFNYLCDSVIIDNNIFIEPNTQITNFRSGSSVKVLMMNNNYIEGANPSVNNIRVLKIGTITQLFKFTSNYCQFGNNSQFFQIDALPTFTILTDNYFYSVSGTSTNVSNVTFGEGTFQSNSFSGCRLNIGTLKNIPQVLTNAGPYQNGNMRLIFGTQQPSVGTFTTGDIVLNLNNSATTLGWKCIAGGSPGRWVEIKNGS